MEESISDFYKESLVLLEGAVIELTSRLDIIRKYRVANKFRDPIEHYTSRIKSASSVREKLNRKGLTETLSSVFEHIYDAAGIRVVCTYIDDVYMVADMLARQEDIEVVKIKDYIKNPKPNGYRSYHMIVRVPLHVGERLEKVYTEIQFRTMAMDFWASLEHQLKYKHDIANQKMIIGELKRCAEDIASTELNFQAIRDMINEGKDTEQ